MLMRTKKSAGEPLRASLVGVPGNEIVPGATVGVAHASDGTALRYAIWGEEMRAPKGTVCLLQGRGEFIEKHFETIADLLSMGYAVATLDWRGQGGSQRLTANPRKGHIGGFKQYDDDLQAFVTQAVLPDCPPPYFGLGHSMGGNILINAAIKRNWFEKVVVTSPLIDLAGDGFPRGLMKLAATFAKAMGLGRSQVPAPTGAGFAAWDFPDNPFTGDITRFERTKQVIEEAPELAVGRVTFGWTYAALQAIDGLAAVRKGTILRTPVLIVAAGRDRVVSTQACREFSTRVANVSTIVLDGARHEILLERDSYREQFWAAFKAFIHDQDPMVPL